MYSSPPPPPPVYGSPYGGFGGREHPQGTTILVMGILSLVIGFACGIGLLLGPVAWVMGNNAIAEIDQNPPAYTNRGSVQAGRICGIVATALLIIGVLLFILIVAASASS